MTLYETKIAQVDEEIDAFIDLLKTESVLSYLEVGSQYGGSLWKVGQSLPKGSRIVSVDYPHPDHGTATSLHQCIDALSKDYDAKVLLGDSTHTDIVRKVIALGPFDCVFIDANHSLPYVTKDWENYGPLARIVAFHDIVWDKPVRPGRVPIEVKKLWDEIKGNYRHQEIVAPDSHKGIGVLWR